MKRIETLGYPIVIDEDCRDHVRELVEQRDVRRVVVLTDATVADRAKRIASALRPSARVSVESFALGERRKTLASVEAVLHALARSGADRTTLVVGVGGGVASDLFGFASAIYMRGVAYATVSTTLVGMADAAIGGKTGVDLPEGKNLAGVFRDPAGVFCDLSSLETLPARALREGLAEVVKAAIIAGPAPFAGLEAIASEPLRDWPWEDVIEDAVLLKCDIVARDREEHGVRELLNLGHTFGHAIEHASGYRVSHGAAVAIGLRAAGMLAIETGRFTEAEEERVYALLRLLRLPVTIDPALAPSDVLRAMQVDKKTRDGEVRFVLPRAIGDVESGVTAPARAVRGVLAGLSARPPTRKAR